MRSAVRALRPSLLTLLHPAPHSRPLIPVLARPLSSWRSERKTPILLAGAKARSNVRIQTSSGRWRRGYASDEAQRQQKRDDDKIDLAGSYEPGAPASPAPTPTSAPTPTEPLASTRADGDAGTEETLKNIRHEGILQAKEDAASRLSCQPPVPAESQANLPQHTSLGEPSTRPSQRLTPDIDTPGDRLPSQTASSRSRIVARFHENMERLLARLAVAGQQLNVYTGTDYTGINALRDKIISLESDMKMRHATVTSTKEASTAALTAQSASQKEVVQLLERKHSWSAADLERYMTLIRSEHLNEQAVQSAKDAEALAERDLEDARAKLEKYERRQYHEEQIWSDTIRRNSTWVTFALMGFNIFLLLFSLVLIEPWRRRRLVKEVRKALEDNVPASVAQPAAVAAGAVTAVSEASPETVTVNEKVVEQVDAAVSPTKETLEDLVETTLASTPLPQMQGAADSYLGVETSPDVLPTIAPEDASQKQELAEDPLPPTFAYSAETWAATLELWKAHWRDLFSERAISLRRVDVTTATLEGAAAGAAFMGLLFVLLRPR